MKREPLDHSVAVAEAGRKVDALIKSAHDLADELDALIARLDEVIAGFSAEREAA